MAEILKGAPAAAAINHRTQERVLALQARGIQPTLALLRVGENDADLYYERGAVKRCQALGIRTVQAVFPAGAGEKEVLDRLAELNALIFPVEGRWGPRQRSVNAPCL